MTPTARVVAVAPGRIVGWVHRFEQRHGQVIWDGSGAHAVLTAVDGARAELRLPDDSTPPPTDAESLAARSEEFRDFGLVLVRRGGYAVGRVDDAELVASRCGTRYVQGQTKAGGWSQQRYARRRANQADELVDVAARAVAEVLSGDGARLALVVGGDRALVDACLEQAGGGRAALVRSQRLDVPDPRKRVLEASVEAARAVRIALNELA